MNLPFADLNNGKGFWVDENTDTPQDYCCCPLCGSIGVVHFEDSSDGEKEHKCLRCDSLFQGCTTSVDKTRAERLGSCEKRKS